MSEAVLRPQPPRDGPGSSRDAWASWAAGAGLEVLPSDGRNDIIAAADQHYPNANVAVDLDEEAAPIVEPLDEGLVHTDLTTGRLADAQNPTPVLIETVVQTPSADSVKPGERRTYRSPYPKLVVQAGPHRAADSNGPQVRAPELGQGRPPLQFSELPMELATPAPVREPFLGHPLFIARGEYSTSDPVEIALLERVPEAVRVA